MAPPSAPMPKARTAAASARQQSRKGPGKKAGKPEWDAWFFESEASGSEAV